MSSFQFAIFLTIKIGMLISSVSQEDSFFFDMSWVKPQQSCYIKHIFVCLMPLIRRPLSDKLICWHFHMFFNQSLSPIIWYKYIKKFPVVILTKIYFHNKWSILLLKFSFSHLYSQADHLLNFDTGCWSTKNGLLCFHK